MDALVQKGKSIFIFYFHQPGGKKHLSKTNVYVNGELSVLDPDTNGRATIEVATGNYCLHFNTYEYEEIKTDTINILSQEKITIKVNFEYDHEPRPVKKPVIYFYPEQTMDIKVLLDVNGKLDFTYPKYDQGWNFTANRQGELFFGNETFNYLFWEGSDAKVATANLNLDEGFKVCSDTLLSFLENTLKEIGLNSKEKQDFITFWYPQMTKNQTNIIRFLFNEECDAFAKLNITPQPSNIFRVSMIWNKVENNDGTELERPFLPIINRAGFTVVEWGGVEINELSNSY